MLISCMPIPLHRSWTPGCLRDLRRFHPYELCSGNVADGRDPWHATLIYLDGTGIAIRIRTCLRILISRSELFLRLLAGVEEIAISRVRGNWSRFWKILRIRSWSPRQRTWETVWTQVIFLSVHSVIAPKNPMTYGYDVMEYTCDEKEHDHCQQHQNDEFVTTFYQAHECGHFNIL